MLKNGKSILVMGSVFMKVYFAIAIEAEDIQQEVKLLLEDTTCTYTDTFKIIYANYRIQATSKKTRDT